MKIGGKPISFSSYSLYLDIIFFSLLNHYLLVVANVNTLGVRRYGLACQIVIYIVAFGISLYFIRSCNLVDA